MRISSDAEVVRHGDWLGAAVGEEQVLLDVERGVYIGLNMMGSEIWRRLEQPVRVKDLCDSLGQEFQADAGRIETEVGNFLDHLLDQGLIRIKQ